MNNKCKTCYNSLPYQENSPCGYCKWNHNAKIMDCYEHSKELMQDRMLWDSVKKDREVSK